MSARTICGMLLCAGLFPGLANTDGSITPHGKDKPPQQGKSPTGDGWTAIRTRHRAAPRFPFESPKTISRPCVKDFISLPGDKQLRLHTKGSDRIGIDLNGDGTADSWGRGERVTFSVPLRISGKRVSYAVQLTQNGAKWRSRRGGYRSLSFKGTSIHLIDDSSDGYYDGYGIDAMVVGRTRYASYLSKVVSIRGKLYQMRVNRAGTVVWFKDWLGETGKIDLIGGFKAGGKLAAAVIKSADLSFNASTVGLTVPAGNYTVTWGRVVKGKKQAHITAGIPVRVETGKTAKLRWGYPFTLDFSAVRKGRRVSVGVSGITITGRAGEIYSLFTPSAFTPYVRIRSKGGRPLASGKMTLG